MCENSTTAISPSNDDVFYSISSPEHNKINTETNQRQNKNSSNEALVNEQESHRRSPSTDSISTSYDPYAQYIQRHNNNQISYQQNVFIRYLRPPTPPEPGPLIVREVHAPQLCEVPPLIIHQQSHIPKTPPPIIIRERPPIPPFVEPPRIIHRYIPAPPPLPSRKIIIQQEPPLPQKPQPIIIEKWLPYKSPPKRRVIVQRAQNPIQRSVQRNTFINYDTPRVNIVPNIRHLDTVCVDPQLYWMQYGSQLASSEYIRNIMNRFGIGNNYSQMVQMQMLSQTSKRKNNHFQTIDKDICNQSRIASSSSSSSDEDHAEFIDEIIPCDEYCSSDNKLDEQKKMED